VESGFVESDSSEPIEAEPEEREDAVTRRSIGVTPFLILIVSV
jgi:hypothetical protein